jgi:hypothetical protein
MLALEQVPSLHIKIHVHLHHRFKLQKYKGTEKITNHFSTLRIHQLTKTSFYLPTLMRLQRLLYQNTKHFPKKLTQVLWVIMAALFLY